MAGADQSSVSLLTSKPAAKEGCRQQDGEAEAHHVALGATPQAHLLKGLLCFSTALFVLFLFSQPMLSWLFNDVLGYAADLCETPADEIQCGNQANYVEIAEKLGRRNAAGELIGCSCEDGILRDWSCAAGATSFSISYFISTAPGTGMMAALSAWPMIGAWFYGAGTLRKMSHADGGVTAEMDILGATLIAFQLFYGLFLVNTTCVAPKFHVVSVVLFNSAAVVHYVTVAYYIGRSTQAGKYINVSVAVAIVAIFLGTVWPESPSWLGQHAFWLGECIGLSSGMSIAPILIYWGNGATQPQEKGPSQLGGAETQAEALVGPAAA